METKLCSGGHHHDQSHNFLTNYRAYRFVFFGFLIGSPVWGTVADRFGHEKVYDTIEGAG